MRTIIWTLAAAATKNVLERNEESPVATIARYGDTLLGDGGAKCGGGNPTTVFKAGREAKRKVLDWKLLD